MTFNWGWRRPVLAEIKRKVFLLYNRNVLFNLKYVFLILCS